MYVVYVHAHGGVRPQTLCHEVEKEDFSDNTAEKETNRKQCCTNTRCCTGIHQSALLDVRDLTSVIYLLSSFFFSIASLSLTLVLPHYSSGFYFSTGRVDCTQTDCVTEQFLKRIDKPFLGTCACTRRVCRHLTGRMQAEEFSSFNAIRLFLLEKKLGIQPQTEKSCALISQCLMAMGKNEC